MACAVPEPEPPLACCAWLLASSQVRVLPRSRAAGRGALRWRARRAARARAQVPRLDTTRQDAVSRRHAPRARPATPRDRRAAHRAARCHCSPASVSSPWSVARAECERAWRACSRALHNVHATTAQRLTPRSVCLLLFFVSFRFFLSCVHVLVVLLCGWCSCTVLCWAAPCTRAGHVPANVRPATSARARDGNAPRESSASAESRQALARRPRLGGACGRAASHARAA